MLALPFQNGAFDAALAVNVLHHAGDRADQDAALAEMARTVRPGGLVLVHEITTVNPLYRLYMAYLFPLWKRIDLGTEVWLDPRQPPTAGGAALAALHHYTFLPDFTPGGLYRYLAPLEQWLERSRWAPYAAHFTAVYRAGRPPPARPPRAAPAPPPARATRGRSREPCATLRRWPPSSAGPPWPWRSGPAPWPSTASTSRGSGSTASAP